MKAIETRRMRGQGGFTLIELLVVIAILAVLAGVVVFAVNGINNNSTETACKTEARTVKTAVQAFYAQDTAYPTQFVTTGSAATNNLIKGLDGFLDTFPASIKIGNADSTSASPQAFGNGTAKPGLVWTGKCTSNGNATNAATNPGTPIGDLPAQP